MGTFRSQRYTQGTIDRQCCLTVKGSRKLETDSVRGSVTLRGHHLWQLGSHIMAENFPHSLKSLSETILRVVGHVMMLDIVQVDFHDVFSLI